MERPIQKYRNHLHRRRDPSTRSKNLDTWHQDANDRPRGTAFLSSTTWDGISSQNPQPIISNDLQKRGKRSVTPCRAEPCAPTRGGCGVRRKDGQPPPDMYTRNSVSSKYAGKGFRHPLLFLPSLPPASPAHAGAGHLWSLYVPSLFIFFFRPVPRHPRQDTSTALGLRLCSARPSRCGCQACQACHLLWGWLSHHTPVLILTGMGLKYVSIICATW